MSAINEGQMDGTVQIFMVGEKIKYRSQGQEIEGFTLKSHMRVRFANGEEVMMANPLFTGLEFRDIARSSGAIIVSIETEAPNQDDSKTVNGFQNRSEIWRNEGV